MAKPLRETARHAAAFRYYMALGDGRSLAEVGKRFGVTKQAVEGWSVAFGWQRRLIDIESKVTKSLQEKAAEDETKSRENDLQIIQAVRVRFAEALKNGTARISAKDFAEVSKLEALIRGKATERSEVSVGGKSFDLFISQIASAIEQVVATHCPNCKHELGIRGALAAALLEAGKSFQQPSGSA